jgi:hypothetical protein
VGCVETAVGYDAAAMYFVELPEEADNPYRDELSTMSYGAVLSEVVG